MVKFSLFFLSFCQHLTYQWCPTSFPSVVYPSLYAKKRPERQVNEGKNINPLHKELLNYGMPRKPYSLFTSCNKRDCGTAPWVFSKPCTIMSTPPSPSILLHFSKTFTSHFTALMTTTAHAYIYFSSASQPHTETLLNSGEVSAH